MPLLSRFALLRVDLISRSERVVKEEDGLPHLSQSLEMEESTWALSGSPKTTQSQSPSTGAKHPPSSLSSAPPTHNQIRAVQTSPASPPPPGGSFLGTVGARSRNRFQEGNMRHRWELRCRVWLNFNNKLVQNSLVKVGN